MMLAWYWLENQNVLNFGEHITPYILNHYGVEWKNWSNRSSGDDECILIIGSELHREKMEELKRSGVKKIHIWGQGKGTGESFNPENYNVKFHLIRGDTTRKQLCLDDDIPTGDPGFVMPLICDIKREEIKNTIYMPHHEHRKNLDKKRELWKFDTYIDIMIDRNSFMSVLKKLVNAEFVMTTSLHVSVICLAYKVPFCVIKTENERLNYYPEKWKDVFDWVGIPFGVYDNPQDGYSWWQKNVSNHNIPHPENILRTFPLHIF